MDLSISDFVSKMAFYMGEINALHPFREGNGRVQREYFRELAIGAGYILDFSETPSQDLLRADIAAFHGDYSPLEEILDKAISAKL